MYRPILLWSIIIMVFLAITSCSEDDCVNGNGAIVTEEISLPTEINGIRFNAAGDVIITPSTRQRITVTTHDNIIPLVNTSVGGGIWDIDFSTCVRDLDEFTVNIEVPFLNSISLAGSGNIRTTSELEVISLEANISGAGNMDLGVSADNVTATISGSGTVTLGGSSDQLTVVISGSGDVAAFELPVDDCIINISGSGSAQTQVEGTLQVTISGSGSVRYRGNPTIEENITGSGSVIDAN